MTEREEVVARTCRVGFAVAPEERVCLSDTMIDADVVAIDVRAFRAIRDKVSPGSRKIRKRESVDVIAREWRERAATRTITKIVSGNRRTVRCEDRSDRRSDSATTGKPVCTRLVPGLQQFAEVADAHSGCRHGHRLRVAGTAKDRRAVSLSVE